MNLHAYRNGEEGYDHLSLKDLLEAQNLYHVHLMRYPNVVASALGRYRIRRGDSWPGGTRTRHGKEPRTLQNSEVRSYSWPCVLVFVDKWEPIEKFGPGGPYDPYQIVPKTLFLPDGRRVPVCVVLAPRERATPPTPEVRFPLNNLGGGRPILARVQGREHVATIACLVRDGHKVLALTNRHVSGETGEILYSQRSGVTERVGVAASKQLTRMPFMELYPGFIAQNAYVNLDIGLIDIDNLDDWTAQIEGIGTMGPMMDLSVDNIDLDLVGCKVRGHGAAGGLMLGEIHALFYRYKSMGGFDYIADFFIGPRTPHPEPRSRQGRQRGRNTRKTPSFGTRPGDSGTLWLLDPAATDSNTGRGGARPRPKDQEPFLPVAVQWGAERLSGDSGAGANVQPYALATCLSTVCNLLDVDPVRDWNLDQTDTWGAIGHFSIAASVVAWLAPKNAKLVHLMKANGALIAPDKQTILTNEFKGMGKQAFVHLADVPDFFWKHGHQGHSRHYEGPNHFADMDQKNDHGTDLLALSHYSKNIDPAVWNEFYDSVTDLLSGAAIRQEHRGLLPFRVWQIFDEMVRFASEGKAAEFLCAAGVLTHYVGDACQPLHISYLHDGDPLRPVTHVVHHKDGTEDERKDPLGKGVHAAYEDDMVNGLRGKILDGLGKVPKGHKNKEIANGFEAARETLRLMRATFKLIPPTDILEEFLKNRDSHLPRQQRIADFCDVFGSKTIQAMKKGTRLLAALWESAWILGAGESNVTAAPTLSEDEAMAICAPRDFLPSLPISAIGDNLTKP